MEHTTLPGVPEPALTPQAVLHPVGAEETHTPRGMAVVEMVVTAVSAVLVVVLGAYERMGMGLGAAELL